MADHSSRISAAADALAAPALLVTDTPGLTWLTGARLEGFWLVLTKRGAAAFAPGLLVDQVRELLPGVEVSSADGLLPSLVAWCGKRGIRTLAVDGDRISYGLALRLRGSFRLRNVPGVLDRLRMVKDGDEIERIRRSCSLAARAADYAHGLMRPGVSEAKIAMKIDAFFARNGAAPAFETIVAAGPNSALPHHLPGTRRIRRDDTVLIDLGCRLDGYCSDLTRTYYFGTMSSLQKKVYTLVDRAKKQAIKQIKSGKRADEVDAAARDTVTRGGYGGRFIHSTGHGVGLEIHEAPRVGVKDRTVLQAGMVVTVEPGIYLPGEFGVRLEDTVLVTKKGSEVLTR